MKPSIFSIKDIAHQLGISPSTVSRALKDHPDISAATREKVKAFAHSVNYRPNALALSLKQQRSNTIGLIIPEIQHHFFSSVISGIEEFAYANEFRVMICQSNEDYQCEVINAQALLDHRVDGVLVSLGKNTRQYDHFTNLINSGVPLVFFDRICESLNTDRVVTDDAGGAKSVTRYIVDSGRRRILHLAAPQHLMIGRERKRGYCEAMQERGLEIMEDFIIPCDTPLMVKTHKELILQRITQADAIFAVNDFTAIATIKLLQEHGYRIPTDIAVAGFGDDPIASIIQPALTTVEQKGVEMGREAARMLIERIHNPDESIPFSERVFPTALVIRESV